MLATLVGYRTSASSRTFGYHFVLSGMSRVMPGPAEEYRYSQSQHDKADFSFIRIPLFFGEYFTALRSDSSLLKNRR